MKALFITAKGNKDGTATLYFGKGLDRKQLVDWEGKELEVKLSTGDHAQVRTPAEDRLSNVEHGLVDILAMVRGEESSTTLIPSCDGCERKVELLNKYSGPETADPGEETKGETE